MVAPERTTSGPEAYEPVLSLPAPDTRPVDPSEANIHIRVGEDFRGVQVHHQRIGGGRAGCGIRRTAGGPCCGACCVHPGQDRYGADAIGFLVMVGEFFVPAVHRGARRDLVDQTGGHLRRKKFHIACIVAAESECQGEGGHGMAGGVDQVRVLPVTQFGVDRVRDGNLIGGGDQEHESGVGTQLGRGGGTDVETGSIHPECDPFDLVLWSLSNYQSTWSRATFFISSVGVRLLPVKNPG